MEISGKIKEDGCNYQSVCRETYKNLWKSDKVARSSYIDSLLFRWYRVLAGANEGSPCGKAIPECKIYSLLENSEQKSSEFLLEKILTENKKLG